MDSSIICIRWKVTLLARPMNGCCCGCVFGIRNSVLGTSTARHGDRSPTCGRVLPRRSASEVEEATIEPCVPRGRADDCHNDHEDRHGVVSDVWNLYWTTYSA
jgi:hypothetical protein